MVRNNAYNVFIKNCEFFTHYFVANKQYPEGLFSKKEGNCNFGSQIINSISKCFVFYLFCFFVDVSKSNSSSNSSLTTATRVSSVWVASMSIFVAIGVLSFQPASARHIWCQRSAECENPSDSKLSRANAARTARFDQIPAHTHQQRMALDPKQQ